MSDLRNLDELATEAWSFTLDHGIINSAIWSPNGKFLVLNCFPDFLVVLDGNNGEEVKRFERLEYSHSRSFWSRDSSLLFSYIHDEIRIWDVETWSVARRFGMPSSGSFAVDPDGSRVAIGYDYGSGLQGYGRVELWQTTDGSKVALIETKASVSGVSLSPSGQLATWSNGGFVRIWDVDDGKGDVVQTLEIEKGMPRRTIWSPSKNWIVVSTTTAAIYIFDAGSGKHRLLDSHCDENFQVFGVNAMAFSSDESWFASKDGDGKVLLWRTTDWLPFAVFQSSSFDWQLRGPPLLAIKPDEPTLLTQNWDCTGVTVWRLGDLAAQPATTRAIRGEQVSSETTSGLSSQERQYEPIATSLCELRRLGAFIRWQEIGERLRDAARDRGPLRNYPLFPGWSEPDSNIDVFDGSRWKRVVFRSWDGKKITCEDQGKVEQLKFHQDTVAPAGHFTDFREKEFSISSAELSTGETLPGDAWIVIDSELVGVDWPYVTLRVSNRPPNDVVASTSLGGKFTFHIADPRLTVNGVRRAPPRFNFPIAVSHRWLNRDHPDQSGAQYQELLDRAAAMNLHPMQPFLIDYCSLPQKPWTAAEQETFDRSMLPFHTAFTSGSIIIKHGAEDYGTRAWCMLELILMAVEGWLADGPNKLQAPPELPFGLGKTWEEAENYLKLANENTRNLSRAISESPTDPFTAYLSDNRNLAFRQAMKSQQNKLLKLFDRELGVTDPSDRPRIQKILLELVFRKQFRF